MKRIMCAVICLALLCSSFALADGAVIEELTMRPSIQKTPNSLFPYEMLVYDDAPNTNSTVYIEYPHFTYSDDDTVDQTAMINELNDMVFSKLVHMVSFTYVMYGFDKTINTKYQCAVTLNNSKVVSMVFWGDSDRPDQRHEYLRFVLNVEIPTMRELRFSDMFRSDNGLADLFLGQSFRPSDPDTTPTSGGISFEEMLSYQQTSSFDYPLHISCFFKPDGVVISILTMHAGGDHFEAQIAYSDIIPYYLLEIQLWEE